MRKKDSSNEGPFAKTRPVKGTNNPAWNERFILCYSTDPRSLCTLKVSAWNWSKIAKDLPM